jgi:peptidoglycan/xylan/chitin deacetylase (PgdA/CDA1 family)
MRARVLIWGALGAAIAGVGALLAGPPAWIIERLATRFPGCVFQLHPRTPLISITLDDGPDAATTPLILAELRRHGARATFFMITERVPGQEELVRRVVREGHELGNHFTRDRPGIRLDPGEFARDLERAHAVLAPFGSIRWARPGSGWYSRAMIATMESRGYRCALGSVYPYDATVPSAAVSSWHILRNARPGAIVVLHDGGARGRRTARVLGTVLPELRRRGFGVVPLSELKAAGVASASE